jgi:hypothetical protein
VATQRRAGAAVAARVVFTVDPALEMDDYAIKWPTTELAHMLSGKRPRSSIPTPVYYTKIAPPPTTSSLGCSASLSPYVTRWWDTDLIFTLSDEMVADIEVYNPEVLLVDEQDGESGDVTLLMSEVEHQITHLELYAHRSWQIRMALLETANVHIRGRSTTMFATPAPSPGTRRRPRTRRTENDQGGDEDDPPMEVTPSPLSAPLYLGGMCEPLSEAIPFDSVSHLATRFVYDTWLRWRGYAADMSRPWGLPLIPSLFEAVPADDFFIPVTDLRTRLGTGTVHLRGLTCSLTADPAVADATAPPQNESPEVLCEEEPSQPALGGSLVDPTSFPFPLPEALRHALRPTFSGGHYERTLQAMEV